MTRKHDIKQFRQACNEAGFSVGERYEASQRATCRGRGPVARQDEVSYGELLSSAATIEGLVATVVALDASADNRPALDARIRSPMRASLTQMCFMSRFATRAEGIWRLCHAGCRVVAPPGPGPARRTFGRRCPHRQGVRRVALQAGRRLNRSTSGPQRPKQRTTPPTAELTSPAGVILGFGPGVRWQVSTADVLRG